MGISFGRISWKIIIPILYICLYFFWGEITGNEIFSGIGNAALTVFILNLARLSCGLFHFVYSISSKVKEIKKESIAKINLDKISFRNQTFGEKSILKREIWYIIVFCLLDGVFSVADTYLSQENQGSSVSIIQMLSWLFNIFLCKFFLKLEINRQHFIPIGINLLSTVILIISNGVINLFNINLHFLWLIFIYCFYVSKLVFEKWIMHSKFVSPLELLFYNGVIGIIVQLIEFTVVSNLNVSENDNFRDFTFRKVSSSFKEQPIGNIVLFFISFGSEFFFYLTNYIYNPIYLSIADLFLLNISFIRIFLKKKIEPIMLTIQLFFGVLIFFSSLVFSEIVIISCFNMNKNTKEEIANRAEKEYEQDVDDINGLKSKLNVSSEESMMKSQTIISNQEILNSI